MSSRDQYQEILTFTKDWARRTDELIKTEHNKLRIGFEKELYPSIRSKVLELAAQKVGVDLSFLTYGRFVDMGAGPGSVNNEATLASIVTRVENNATNRALITAGKMKKKKVRRPKKFYSRVFYARLNALMGVVSGSMVEEAVRIVKEEAKQI